MVVVSLLVVSWWASQEREKKCAGGRKFEGRPWGWEQPVVRGLWYKGRDRQAGRAIVVVFAF